MNKKDIQYFKTKLENEKKILENELSSIGKINKGNPSGWEVTAGKIEIDSADENETADKMEEMEENELIFSQLEKQLSDVNNALEHIEKGTYGICEVSGKPIERDRLEANPSARTCIAHMK